MFDWLENISYDVRVTPAGAIMWGVGLGLVSWGFSMIRWGYKLISKSVFDAVVDMPGE